MPNPLFDADIGFPNLSKEKSTDAKLKAVENYLYMLLESLRYSFGNIEKGNFNESGYNDIVTEIRKPLYVKIEDAEGNIAAVDLKADEISAELTNAKGDISTLTQTAEEISAELTNAKGDITTLKATAEGLAADIEDAEGNIAAVDLKADEISAELTNAKGDITTLKTTAEGLAADIEDAEENIAAVDLKADEISAELTNAQGDITTLKTTATEIKEQVSAIDGRAAELKLTADGLTTTITSVQDTVKENGEYIANQKTYITESSDGISIAKSGEAIKANFGNDAITMIGSGEEKFRADTKGVTTRGLKADRLILDNTWMVKVHNGNLNVLYIGG